MTQHPPHPQYIIQEDELIETVRILKNYSPAVANALDVNVRGREIKESDISKEIMELHDDIPNNNLTWEEIMGSLEDIAEHAASHTTPASHQRIEQVVAILKEIPKLNSLFESHMEVKKAIALLREGEQK